MAMGEGDNVEQQPRREFARRKKSSPGDHDLTISQASDAMSAVELIRWFVVDGHSTAREAVVNGLIYLIGLIVVIMFILSFLGLH